MLEEKEGREGREGRPAGCCLPVLERGPTRQATKAGVFGAFGLVLRLSSRFRLSALGLVKIERFVDFDSAEEQVSLDAD